MCRLREIEIPNVDPAPFDDARTTLGLDPMSVLDIHQMYMVRDDLVVAFAQESNQRIGAVETARKHDQGDLRAPSDKSFAGERLRHNERVAPCAWLLLERIRPQILRA